MCSTINSLTRNPVVGAYSHVIRGAHQYERCRVVSVAEDSRSCVLQVVGSDIVYGAEKYDIYKNLWVWRVLGVQAAVNFTNVPRVGFRADHIDGEGNLIHTTVAAVSEDGTEVTLANGTTVVLAEYGGYPNTRFKVAR